MSYYEHIFASIILTVYNNTVTKIYLLIECLVKRFKYTDRLSCLWLSKDDKKTLPSELAQQGSTSENLDRSANYWLSDRDRDIDS